MGSLNIISYLQTNLVISANLKIVNSSNLTWSEKHIVYNVKVNNNSKISNKLLWDYPSCKTYL